MNTCVYIGDFVQQEKKSTTMRFKDMVQSERRRVIFYLCPVFARPQQRQCESTTTRNEMCKNDRSNPLPPSEASLFSR